MPQDLAYSQAAGIERLIGLDLARGLAICGMIIVHFHVILRGPTATGYFLKALDGRPATLFMLLAGVGLSLLLKGRSPDTTYVRRLLLKRGLFLLAVGYLNLIVWPGDILRVYGVSFCIAVLLVSLSRRGLALTALGFVFGFLLLLSFVDFAENWDFETLTYNDLWSPAGNIRHLFFDGFRSVLPWTGVLVLGMLIGRMTLWNPVWQKRVIASGAALYFAAEFFSRFALRRAQNHPDVLADAELLEVVTILFSTESLPALPLFLLSSIGSALFFLGVSLTLAQKFPTLIPVRAIVSVGQMAFTWYLGHIYGGALVLYAVGWTTESSAVATVSAIAYFGVIAMLSMAWRRRRQRGPLEKLLRRVCG